MAATIVARCAPLKPQLKFWAVQVTPSSAISIRTAVQMNSTIAKATLNTTGVGEAVGGSAADTVVQYTWPLGSIVTQGCHASVAAIWANKDNPETVLYCSPPNLDSMHKVTLEVKGETQLVNLSEKLKVGGVAHKLWIEHSYMSCN